MINELQELALGDSNTDGLLLHLIRTIALYLFVFLSKTSKLVPEVELAVFVSDAATLDLLDQQTKELRDRLHTVLLEWIQREMNSNQFHELQEQRAFVVMKRLFRHQRNKVATQCRVLVALLTSYLTRLETPLVLCESSSMLASTLEYLLSKEKDAANRKPVPLSMIYPLVNAVDLVSIEQRECLDALVNLLRWLSSHDQSQKIFTTFTSKYHAKMMCLTDENGNSDNVDNRDELGVCFVQMLLRYSDHIFRRDVQFEDVIPSFLYSDTEDDGILSDDGSSRSRQHSNNSRDTSDNLSTEDFNKSKMNSVDINLKDNKPTTSQSDLDREVLAKNAVNMKHKDGVIIVGPSRSQRKRKKREEKAMEVPVKNACRATSCSQEAEFEDGHLLWEQEEPLPAVMCVGIAAAAAAVICVYFN
ncbi:hypothetical protein PHMEG_0004202 [Phytophthora megakarya]|uniref:Uncharacterized protein n=1 Tax=Phytophthora megakarya TaxID=4795 RepID=A0A225WUF0_9STRA|nr:hypothetical protein PHMEG_0004202 [Phytophthora megakarya]